MFIIMKYCYLADIVQIWQLVRSVKDRLLWIVGRCVAVIREYGNRPLDIPKFKKYIYTGTEFVIKDLSFVLKMLSRFICFIVVTICNNPVLQKKFFLLTR